MEIKKKSYVKLLLLLVSLMFVSCLIFSGCIFTLDTPNISVYGKKVYWNAVENATSYELVLTDEEGNETTEEVNGTSKILSRLSPGTWKVKVRAMSTSPFRNNSEFSEEKSIVFGEGLDVPTNLVVEKEGNDVVGSWAPTGSDSYAVKVVGPNEASEEYMTDSDSFKLTSYLTLGGVYKISVQSVSDNGESISVSDFCEPVEYQNYITLEAPKITSFSDGYILSWSSVPQATSYKVSLLGTDKTFTSTSTSYTFGLNDLANLAKVDGVYNKTAFQVAFVQAISSNDYCNDSDFSLGEPHYGLVDNAINYGKIKIDYFYSSMTEADDEEFDFCADTQDELNALVKFTIFYRLQTVKFYKTFDQTYTSYKHNTYSGPVSDIKVAFDDFGEIMLLTRSESHTLSSPKKYTENITYYTPSTPTLVADKNVSGGNSNTKIQANYGNRLNSYSKNPRSSDVNYDEEDLPIYDRIKKMNVYTSEQLFMAVQAGYLPVFVGNCGAKIVWDKACEILIDILDDTMTDYEKTLAIFDWVCYTNKYDYNVVSYSNMGETWYQYYNQATNTWTNDEARENYYNIRKHTSWYLEGMFLSNGQAVCDGISKTFSLLCGIENIKAIKCNGVGQNSSSSSGENHAWNKVFIATNDGTEKQWYGVDCTWADFSTSSDVYEYLIHNDYFLVSDDVLNQNHVEYFPCYNDTATRSYDYFANTKITIDDQSYSMDISPLTSQSTIQKIVNYMCQDLEMEYFEIKGVNKAILSLYLPSDWIAKDYKYIGNYVVCYKIQV